MRCTSWRTSEPYSIMLDDVWLDQGGRPTRSLDWADPGTNIESFNNQARARRQQRKQLALRSVVFSAPEPHPAILQCWQESLGTNTLKGYYQTAELHLDVKSRGSATTIYYNIVKTQTFCQQLRLVSNTLKTASNSAALPPFFSPFQFSDCLN
jgi:hypothetical protein